MVSHSLSTERALVTIVLPCLNEEGSVGVCVDEALKALSAAGIPSEVLVVDNNSTDHSVDIALAHGARVIRERRPGYGSALRAGIEAAAGEIVVMADADHTYDLSTVAQLILPVANGEADIVVAERLSQAPRSTMPFLHRRLGTPVLSLLVRRAALGLTVTDCQSGYRAFRRDAILGLGMKATGMEFASEMLIKAGRSGFRVIETSTPYRERIGESKLNTFSDGWRHARQILLLAPNLMLVAPGALLVAFGLALVVVGLFVPSGLSVGSLRWQPSFICGIALVIGVQAIIAGFVLSELQREKFGNLHRHSHRRGALPAMCLIIGLVVGLGGVGIDVTLFVNWLSSGHAFSRELEVAALAQSMVIDGASLVGFGIIYPILVRSSWGTVGIEEEGGWTPVNAMESTEVRAPQGSL